MSTMKAVRNVIPRKAQGRSAAYSTGTFRSSNVGKMSTAVAPEDQLGRHWRSRGEGVQTPEWIGWPHVLVAQGKGHEMEVERRKPTGAPHRSLGRANQSANHPMFLLHMACMKACECRNAHVLHRRGRVLLDPPVIKCCTDEFFCIRRTPSPYSSSQARRFTEQEDQSYAPRR
jgi:hypothetical protein